MNRLVFFFFCLLTLVGCNGINSYQVDNDFQVHTLYSTLSNIHIVEYNDVLFMIDAGVHGDESRVERKIEALGYEAKNLAFIMLTHGHTDHSGTAKYFQDKYQIPIICGLGDEEMLLSGTNDSLCPTNMLGTMIKWVVPETYPSLTPTILVDGEYSLSEFGVDGTIFPMHGHTHGSIALLLKDVAFVGDIIRGKAMAKKTPELHFFQCDLEKNKGEIEKALDWNCSLWFTGHFGPLKPSRVNAWLENNPYN